MNNELNKLLSDLAVFYRKLQNYHWNIKGSDFFTVHAKLEEYYDDVNKQIDEIAEHLLILGYEPLGTLKDYLANTNIQEASNEKILSCQIFQEVKKDLETLLNRAKRIKKMAEGEEEYVTSSLMDGYMEDYSKKIWMISQMQES